MQLTLESDSLGRVVGTIEYNGARATVSGADAASSIRDLGLAIESASADGLGECYWLEARGEYRWLFRREGNRMRIAVLWSSGTLTGWEHRFWAEIEMQELRAALAVAMDSCSSLSAAR